MLNSLLMMKDPNLIANVLVTHITEAIDIVAPMTKIQRRYKYAPHLSLETKERMSERDQLKQISFASKAVEDELNFKKARNLALKCQRSDRQQWAKKLLEKNPNNKLDSKSMWSTMKQITGEDKRESIEKLIVKGIVTNKSEEMANGLNNYFIEKVEKMVKSMPPQHIDILQDL